jgi:hypothetical protein
MSQQLTLQIEPSLVERHRNVRDVVSTGVYQRGLTLIAGKLDKSPGTLSSALSADGRVFSVDDLELYIEKTGDTTPIEYLVARYIGATPELIAAARAERGQRLLAEAIALMREVAPVVRARR